MKDSSQPLLKGIKLRLKQESFNQEDSSGRHEGKELKVELMSKLDGML